MESSKLQYNGKRLIVSTDFEYLSASQNKPFRMLALIIFRLFFSPLVSHRPRNDQTGVVLGPKAQAELLHSNTSSIFKSRVEETHSGAETRIRNDENTRQELLERELRTEV